METRSESSAKRARESFDRHNNIKVQQLTSIDKAFLKDLITESESITSEVIKNSIAQSERKHFDFIKNFIRESEERILSVIESKLGSVKVQLNAISERVEKLESKSSETNDMKKEIIELKRKVLKHENSVVAGSVRISGIPYYENENLYTIFNNICGNMKIPVPQIDNIYRLKKIYRNNKPYTPKDEVIVAKLRSPFEKNFLLKSIAKFRRETQTNLRLSHAGFESDQNIYINEDLTPHNHQIFKAALNMKKNKEIKSTFTLRGLVYVKKFDADDPFLVEFIEDLNNLFRE